jgi:nitronate monooxygenase
MKTRITELLGIRYPIVCGGMAWVGRAELAAAVSNAGALGMVTALTQPDGEALIREVARCRDMTDRPFGVNLTFTPRPNKVPYEDYAHAIAASGVKVVETAGNNPERFVAIFKKAGITIIHKCTSVRHGVSAEKLGCDVVSMDGWECAGSPGRDEVGNMVLIPVAADRIRVPLLASGGMGDGRSLAAAIALGADGINMGTRFMATREAPIPDSFKQALVDADERGSVHIMRSISRPRRVFRNKASLEILEIEKQQPDGGYAAFGHLVSGERNRVGYENGDPQYAAFSSGPVLGLIRDIPSCKELIERIVADARDVARGRMASTLF